MHDFTATLVRRHILTEAQLQGARLLQRQTHDELPDVLVAFGYASREQVRAALTETEGPAPALTVECMMHRNHIAVLGETAFAYCLVTLRWDRSRVAAHCGDVTMHLRPIRGNKVKRLRQVAPDIRPIDLHEPEPSHLVGQLGTLERDAPVKYILDIVLPKRPDGKYVIAHLEISFDPGTGQRASVTVPITVVYTSAGHGYINAEVARHIDETQIAELNASLQQAVDQGQAQKAQRVAEQIVMKKGELMGKGAARKTTLAKQVLEDNAARETRDFDQELFASGAAVFCEEFSVADAQADKDTGDFELAAKYDAAPQAAAAPKIAAASRSVGRLVGKGIVEFKKGLKGLEETPLVERQATIRYYNRMSPERMFPLLVVISRKAIQEVVKRHVVQQQSQTFQVQLDSFVEIEPILPGCECFPPKESVRITDGEAQARFFVVPRVLGNVMHARVIVRQDGKPLTEVPLEIVVSKQTLTVFVGALNFGVPFVSMLLKQSQLSLASGDGGAGLLAKLVGWLLLMLSPEVMAGLLLLATVGLYFWLRPKQRDVFWDIQPVPEPSPTSA